MFCQRQKSFSRYFAPTLAATENVESEKNKFAAILRPMFGFKMATIFAVKCLLHIRIRLPKSLILKQLKRGRLDLYWDLQLLKIWAGALV